jgi:hypothetical protein
MYREGGCDERIILFHHFIFIYETAICCLGRERDGPHHCSLIFGIIGFDRRFKRAPNVLARNYPDSEMRICSARRRRRSSTFRYYRPDKIEVEIPVPKKVAYE